MSFRLMADKGSARKAIVAVPIALCCAYFTLATVGRGVANPLANTFLGLLATVVGYRLVLRAFERESIRARFCAAVPGTLLSIAFVLGVNMDMRNYSYALQMVTLAKIVMLSIPFTGAVLWLYGAADRVSEPHRCPKQAIQEGRAAQQKEGVSGVDGTTWLACSFIPFCCWTPFFLAFFPGLFTYDTPFELMGVTATPISAHHPLLHSYFLFICLKIGLQLFGNVTLGGMLYTLLQMILLATMLGWLCAEVARLARRPWLAYASAALFALCPVHSILAISCTKDVLAGGVLSILLAWVHRGIEEASHGCVPISRKTQWMLALLCFVACALRNNAVYAIVVFIPIVAVFIARHVKHAWVALALPMVVAVSLHMAITGPGYRMLGINTSSRVRESLSIPLQQLARTAMEGGDISEEDQAYIAGLIPSYISYRAGISDPVKFSFDDKVFQSDPLAFFTVWVRVGLKNPSIYIDAFVANTHRSWHAGAISQRQGDSGYHPYLGLNSGGDEPIYEAAGILEYYPSPVTLHPALSAVRNAVRSTLGDGAWEKIPVAATIMNTGTQIWVYVLALGYASYRRKGHYPLELWLMVLYWGTLLLGPVVLVRYLYPLYCCVPYVLCTPFMSSALEDDAESV